MSDRPDRSVSPESSVTVRYWAAARAAAGVESDRVAVSAGTTLAEGQTVEFDVGPGRKSEEAKNVRSV